MTTKAEIFQNELDALRRVGQQLEGDKSKVRIKIDLSVIEPQASLTPMQDLASQVAEKSLQSDEFKPTAMSSECDF